MAESPLLALGPIGGTGLRAHPPWGCGMRQEVGEVTHSKMIGVLVAARPHMWPLGF